MRFVFETGAHSAPVDAYPVQQKQELSLNQFLEHLALSQRVSSGVSVTPDNAMRCTTIQGIVRALTNAIGSYPPTVVRKRDQQSQTIIENQPRHAVTGLLNKPNGVHTATQFWRMATQHVALHGNFYALKIQSQGAPVEALRPIENPDAVTVDDVDWRSGVTYRVDFDDNREPFVHQSRMFHCTSGITEADGVTGISPVVQAKEAIGICIAAEQLIAQLYGNNDVPTMALIGGMFRSEEDYKLWSEKFKAARGQVSEGRGGTLLLPEGMEVKEMSFKPADAQLLEMRKFQRIEIAQVYGVPPHKLADLERATFSNIEEQSLEFVRDVAAPWVQLVSQAASRDLLSEQDRQRGLMVRFDMEQATEGKLQDRLTAYGKAHEIGAMNPNEIRQRLGMNPRTDDGGSAYATPLNMRTSDDEQISDDNSGEPAGGPDEDGDGQQGGVG